MKKRVISGILGIIVLGAAVLVVPIGQTVADDMPEGEILSVEANQVNSTGTTIESNAEVDSSAESTLDTYPVAGVTKALMDLSNDFNEKKAEIEESGVERVAEPLEEDLETVVIDVEEYTMYVTDILNIREEPNTDSDVVGKFVIGNEVTVTGEVEGSDFVRITYKEKDAFIHSDYLSEEEPEIEEVITYTWDGAVLNRLDGTVTGPSGKETYYNLDMSGVVRRMRQKGFSEEEYPYWIRSDGCKMLGDYIMVAADLNIRPRGTTVPTSLGMGLVCDTGTFAQTNHTQLDIATNW